MGSRMRTHVSPRLIEIDTPSSLATIIRLPFCGSIHLSYSLPRAVSSDPRKLHRKLLSEAPAPVVEAIFASPVLLTVRPSPARSMTSCVTRRKAVSEMPWLAVVATRLLFGRRYQRPRAQRPLRTASFGDKRT